MSCREIKKQLMLFLDGELLVNEREKVRLHLAGCARCQKELLACEKKKIAYPRGASIAPVWRVAWPQRLTQVNQWNPLFLTSLLVLLVGLLTARTMYYAADTDVTAVQLPGHEIDLMENLDLVDNLEILENMDFFEDLDVIENLEINGLSVQPKIPSQDVS